MSLSLFDLPLTEELVAGLEQLFPPRCPGLLESERGIFFYTGQQRLVWSLRQALEHQKKQAGNTIHDQSVRTINRLAGC